MPPPLWHPVLLTPQTVTPASALSSAWFKLLLSIRRNSDNVTSIPPSPLFPEDGHTPWEVTPAQSNCEWIHKVQVMLPFFVAFKFSCSEKSRQLTPYHFSTWAFHEEEQECRAKASTFTGYCM